MKFLNIKLIIGTVLILGTTACGNKTAYNGDDSKLTTNLSDTMGYDTTTNDNFNYSLTDSYTGYNGTNGYMTNDRIDYITDNNSSITDYKGQSTARRYNNRAMQNRNLNNTYDNVNNNRFTQVPYGTNTDYDMLLDDTYNREATYNMGGFKRMIENGKIENSEMATKNMSEAAKKTADDLNELADTTMEEVRDMTNTLRNDANDYVTTNDSLRPTYDTDINISR